jgi:hypothetical protein
MRDLSRDPNRILDGQYFYLEDVTKEMIRSMYCLSHDAALEEPNEAMKSSQAALNLANALAVLTRIGEVTHHG